MCTTKGDKFLPGLLPKQQEEQEKPSNLHVRTCTSTWYNAVKTKTLTALLRSSLDHARRFFVKPWAPLRLVLCWRKNTMVYPELELDNGLENPPLPSPILFPLAMQKQVSLSLSLSLALWGERERNVSVCTRYILRCSFLLWSLQSTSDCLEGHSMAASGCLVKYLLFLLEFREFLTCLLQQIRIFCFLSPSLLSVVVPSCKRRLVCNIAFLRESPPPSGMYVRAYVFSKDHFIIPGKWSRLLFSGSSLLVDRSMNTND